MITRRADCLYGGRLDATGKQEMNMNMDFLRGALVAVCIISAGGILQAQQVGAKPVISATAPATQPTPALPPPPAAGPLTISPNYVIGADDLLNIQVWKEPQLSGQFPVRPDGKITLLLIHDIMAAGYTPEQLTADITARLTKFVTDPVVDVSVVAVNSKHVFMVGEVERPGPMQITPGMTILQAIASAGLTPYANKSHIYIWRGDPAHQQKVAFDYKKAIKKGDMQGVSLLPGDTIVVP
jgi:polysaccharide export outer membrane protein